jgi:hypothetical protein
MPPPFKTGLLLLAGFAAVGGARAGDLATLGANSCSASGCHGGAGERGDQFVIWSQRDVHSRSFATLTTSRASRMAEALAISNPAASPRCVTCHAPLEGIDRSRLGAGVDPTEGVSCASCHNMPDNWLRGHTRTDWTHADRVAAGMRDLDDLYTRANTCVACHQNIDPEIVAVGRHPELTFELDGQSQDEPRHWREHGPSPGPQAWFVGQAVALREVSWALQNGRADASRSVPVWQGLAWLLARSSPDFGTPPPDPSNPGPAAFSKAVESADLLARRAAAAWKPQYAADMLRRLSATQGDFLEAGTSPLTQACRAERLVLALDRLLGAIPAGQRPAGLSARLDRLFLLAQSRPDFSPADFSRELDGFSRELGR